MTSIESDTISRSNLVSFIREGMQRLGDKRDITDIQFGDLSLELIPIKVFTEEPEVKTFRLNGESS
jgi:hypothetical protein